MANVLKMATVESILQLRSLNWSARKIAQHLGIDRETVGKRLREAESGSKPAIPPTGFEGSKPATYPPVPGTAEADSGSAGSAASPADSKPAIPPAGSTGSFGGQDGTPQPSSTGNVPSSTTDQPPPAKPGRPSECEPYRPIILAKLDQGLSAQRIFQDLAENGFPAGYDSVKRFVHVLGRSHDLPVRRMECQAGEEAQVDFGTGAPIVGPDGKRRKTHVFRIVLSHSRKGYSEATNRQTTEDFIRCLENAFRHFGGCPAVLVIDNLRAAVKHPDWFDPELVPKLQSFCQHYGVVILPTRPYTPRHKGKVESGVKYVQNNALKARTFPSLEKQNEHLAHWESTVADTRIHGTTRRQVGKVFHEVERPALKPLPLERFPCFQEAPRKVNRDGHVEVGKAYYSAPPEYLGRTVWARWDARLVRIFNRRFEQLTVHLRQEPGRFSTHPQHLAPEKISGVERGAEYLLTKIRAIGPQSHQWAEAMLHARGIEGTRVLQGLISLTGRHPSEALEKACETALSHGAFHLRTLRQLIGRQADRQTPLPFLDEHPIIRPLDDYAAVVNAALDRKTAFGGRFGRHDWTKECALPEQNGPGSENHRGAADILPPRSGYPSSGCSPAEPDSVSPDTSSVIVPSVSDHLKKENEFHE